MNTPIQDYYPQDIAICYGCGRSNPKGLHIKTQWNGTEGICHFQPRPEHTAFPGFVYGGLIASVIDCHAIGTVIAATYDKEGRKPGTRPPITYVTGTLAVKYLIPTPTEKPLELRAMVMELGAKKAIVHCSVFVENKECVKGEVIAIRAPWGDPR